MTNEIENILNQVFGGTARVIKPLLGGMMNQSFIVENDEQKYVLYISTEQANEMVDRQLEKDNQSIVYNLGLTSKNVYFDTIKGNKINEYIEGSSLDKAETYDIDKVATLLKNLHASKILSRDDYEPFKRFINYENEALSFEQGDETYKHLREIVFNNKDLLERRKKTLCHNDAQKSNIVKSDDDKYYLIDFEFMANNDPIYDIATFGNGSVKEGYELLIHYYDNPSLEEKKVYFLWRIFVSLQWHNVAIVKHHRGEGKTHGFNFKDVANYFLDNAMTAYNMLKEIK